MPQHQKGRRLCGKGILDLTDEELDVVEKKLAAGKIGISAIGSPIGKIGIEDDFAYFGAGEQRI